MVMHDTDKFLTELAKMYARNQTSGTVRLTMKRTTMPTKPTPSKRKAADGAEPMATDEEMACLIRAQDNKKKISATVPAKDHMRFQAAYTVLLKAHMHALKKRERDKKKKTTSKAEKV